MLGLGFTLEEPQLKAMYLNLLAAASDRRVQDSAHPSFAEIIKQLSASESQSLAAVLKVDSLPIVEIRVAEPSATPPPATDSGLGIAAVLAPLVQSYTVFARNVLDWRSEGEQVVAPEGAIFIDNWVRLGLVAVGYTSAHADEAQYSWVETTPLMVAARKQHETGEQRVTFQKGVLRPTEFGRLFERVVISSEPKALTTGQSTSQACRQKTSRRGH
jgi:hypothetical protein